MKENKEAVIKAPKNALKVTDGVEKPYYAGIDIIKILAVFLVVCIHFFLYSGFYSTHIASEKWIIPIATRWLAYICVPLFMISTGYLMKNKKISAGYYKGLIKIIVIYIVVSLICMKFNHDTYQREFTVWTALKGFLEYSNANYGWYVNYYICIFALVPFLNLAFNGLETKGQRLTLVVTVTLITVFARSLFLGFEANEQIRLFPNYLDGMWPLAYYFTGAFIREYPIKTKNKLPAKLLTGGILLGAVWFISESTYAQTCENSLNKFVFFSRHFNDYSTYPVFIIAVCVFILLCDIKTTNKPVKFILRQLSGCTFATYLISYVFDNKFYMDFNAKYSDVYDRWTHAYEIIGKVFICALVCGLAIHNIYNVCELCIKKLTTKKEKEVSQEN
ncbi:MAG: acyltransferase family protein [Ruminococcus sp.]|nr:acyltransferase family protein [Ruminococcus sp.]